MLSQNLIDTLKDHKQELACIGAASICYNLIQYLRKRNNPKKDHHRHHDHG